MKQKFLLLFFVLYNSFLFSQTIINEGSISGTWTKANSPYLIFGEVTVDNGEVLTIESGVQIEFQGHFKFIVEGSLFANGVQDDQIVFTSSDENTFGHGLWFWVGEENEASELSHCIIEKNYGTDEDKSKDNPNQNAGGIVIHTYSNVLIQNCIIQNNKADITSGIVIYTCSPKIYNTKIINNEGAYALRGIQTYNPEIVGCLIANNIGGVRIGSALGSQINAKVINCTICNNSTTSIYSNSITMFVSGITIKNTIIFGNEPSLISVLGSGTKTVKFYNCDIEGGRDAISVDSPNTYLLTYENNIEMPPIFVDEENQDYHLAESPCINGGTSNLGVSNYTLDLDGNPRVFNDGINKIDIGAYEYQDNLPNRSPFVRPFDRTYVFNGTSRNMTYYHFDADMQNNHTIELSSSNTNITPTLIELNDLVFRVNVMVNEGFIDSAYIKYTITDNSGATNASFIDSTLIITTNQFEGLIYEEFIFRDTVKVIGNITIEPEGKLTILPGTYIQFQGWYGINVYGGFSASGTEDAIITFNATDTATYEHGTYTIATVENGWKGLNFYGITDDTTKLEYCHILNTGLEKDNFSSIGNTTVVILNSANFIIDHCIFESNFTRDSDWEDPSNSGVVVQESENILIRNSSFPRARSRGKKGAFIQAYNAKLVVESCVFDTILCDNPLYGPYYATHFYESYVGNSSYLIKGNTFQHLNGKAIHLSATGYVITENLIKNNWVTSVKVSGAGIVSNNYFFDNLTSHNATLECLVGEPVSVIGNLFVNNRLECNCSNFNGSAIYIHGCDALVANNTIVLNSQDSNGETVYAEYCTPRLLNNIFWENDNEGFGYYNGAIGMDPPIVYNNLIPGGYGDDNFDFDPKFSEYYPYNCQLSPFSSCINLGNSPIELLNQLPESDIEGNIRIDSIHNIIDLGAYEANPTLNIPLQNLISTIDLIIQPNPAKDKASIKFNLSSHVQLSFELFDCRGSKIVQIATKQYDAGEQEVFFDLGNLSSGIYTILLKSSEWSKTIKLVVYR